MRHFIFLFIALVICALPVSAFGAEGQPTSKESAVVELHTTKGVIVVELNSEKAPATTANFKQYVEDGFYDGTIFHRVIPEFMVQGGGLTAELKEKKTREPIKNEADNGLLNEKYTIAMARTNAPHSASSQFFINVKSNPFLNYKAGPPVNWGYCVFGKVIEGQDVVDAIEKETTQTVGYYENVPVTPVVITKAVLRK